MTGNARKRKTPRQELQPGLPLVAPETVRDHGLRAVHPRPHVGRIRDRGRRAGEFWSGRVPSTHAWAYPWINVQDAGSVWATMTFDCDSLRGVAAGMAELPPYSWAVWTERGAHLTWCLADPVGRMDAHRPGPQRMLARANEYFHHALDADGAFGGLGRNPAHGDARVTWGAGRPHYLADLCDAIPPGWRRPRIPESGIGRQVDLFEAACRWAGSECNAGAGVLAMLRSVNGEVADRHGRPPMPDHVLADIAQRVERYRAKWIVSGWHSPAWIERQRQRGAKGGKSKAGRPDVKGRIKRSVFADMTDQELAELMGVHRNTIGNWKRSGKLAEKIVHLANTVKGHFNRTELSDSCPPEAGDNDTAKTTAAGGGNPPESGLDSGPSTGPESGLDSGPSTGPESGLDSGPSTGPESGLDSGPSTGPESGLFGLGADGGGNGLGPDLTDWSDPRTREFWKNRHGG